ncbi:MAG: SRPBCC family protein [Pseudomonadota bacterium]
MLKKIAIGLAAIIVIILVMALLQPNSFTVKRSIAIKAPAEKILPLISDFHQWGSWSPWEHLDPAMKRTFSGSTNGNGAIYDWSGNDDVGSGRMEVIAVTVPTNVTIKLDFFKPFEANNVTEFTLDTKGDTTTVNWNMRGPMPFLSKLMCVFVSMDKMIGKDFEKGLANMKTVAEK